MAAVFGGRKRQEVRADKRKQARGGVALHLGLVPSCFPFSASQLAQGEAYMSLLQDALLTTALKAMDQADHEWKPGKLRNESLLLLQYVDRVFVTALKSLTQNSQVQLRTLRESS